MGIGAYIPALSGRLWVAPLAPFGEWTPLVPLAASVPLIPFEDMMEGFG